MKPVLAAPTLVGHRCGNVAAPRTWYWVLILGNFVLLSLCPLYGGTEYSNNKALFYYYGLAAVLLSDTLVFIVSLQSHRAQQNLEKSKLISDRNREYTSVGLTFGISDTYGRGHVSPELLAILVEGQVNLTVD